jgi:hypothetical protein
MQFRIKDNNGNIHISKKYSWNKENGIPNEEQILEDIDNCSCSLNESNAYCDSSCSLFDEGEVLEIIEETKQEQIEWLELIRDTMLEKSAHTGKDDDYWIFEEIEFRLRHLKVNE